MSRRGSRTGDSRHYYDWLEFAAEDLHCADILLDRRQCPAAAGFHCQQAIEKALKAFVLYRTGSHVDGHNITWLCRQAGRYDETFLSWLDKTPALNRLYIETRYPADMPVQLDFDWLRQVYYTAEEIYDSVCGTVYAGADAEED